MTFEEWYAIDSDREFATAKDFCQFVWQAATEQSHTRIAELEINFALEHDDKEQLEAQVAMLREALKYADKEFYLCDLVDRRCADALTATSDDWLKRHDAETIANFLEQSGKWMTNDAMLAKRDAEVLRKAAGMLEYGFRKTMADQLCDMADELEGDAK